MTTEAARVGQQQYRSGNRHVRRTVGSLLKHVGVLALAFTMLYPLI